MLLHLLRLLWRPRFAVIWDSDTSTCLILRPQVKDAYASVKKTPSKEDV